MHALILCFLILNVTIKGRGVHIEISSGKLRGTIERTSSSWKPYYAFRGIRYAENPRRFEPATPVKPWSGIYDATSDKPTCIQVIPTAAQQSEDCLFINVYTPVLRTRSRKQLAVMFWVYGGGFIFGDSQSGDYAPDYFIDDNVIVVTINYRLGIFGFLSTGDQRIPGNNGMKDIILGLAWVQENIRYFGGDPKRVTIFGESAGAVLVTYLTLSPLTRGKGYFVRAIAQSGNALVPWGIQRNATALYEDVLSKTLCYYAKSFNYDLECLQWLDPRLISLAQTAILGTTALTNLHVMNGIPFCPVYEPPGKYAAIINGTYKILKSGDVPNVPFIMGVNSNEAAIVDRFAFVMRIVVQNYFNKTVLVPADMYISSNSTIVTVAQKICKYYFGEQNLMQSSNENLITYMSDNFFNRPFRKYISLVGNRVPNYCYIFSYMGSTSKRSDPQLSNHQVGHIEELGYFWKKFLNITISEYDIAIKNQVVRLWTNFAKTGNPTPTTTRKDNIIGNFRWPTSYANDNEINCLNVDTQLGIVKNPKENQFLMWNQLYNDYGNPQDTY